jgi:hypothetical protein
VRRGAGRPGAVRHGEGPVAGGSQLRRGARRRVRGCGHAVRHALGRRPRSRSEAGAPGTPQWRICGTGGAHQDGCATPPYPQVRERATKPDNATTCRRAMLLTFGGVVLGVSDPSAGDVRALLTHPERDVAELVQASVLRGARVDTLRLLPGDGRGKRGPAVRDRPPCGTVRRTDRRRGRCLPCRRLPSGAWSPASGIPSGGTGRGHPSPAGAASGTRDIARGRERGVCARSCDGAAWSVAASPP